MKDENNKYISKRKYAIKSYDSKKYEHIKFFDAYYDTVNKKGNIQKENNEDFDDLISSSICIDEDNEDYTEIDKIDRSCCIIL